MALNIKNEETYRLARELAQETGETLTDAVKIALQDRLATLRRGRNEDALLAEIARIQEFVASLPDLDTRSADEILGYDERGLPG